MKLKHILILQNKIDLVKESQAKEQYEQILAFVQGEFCVPPHLDPVVLRVAGLTSLRLLQARWRRALPSFRSRRS